VLLLLLILFTIRLTFTLKLLNLLSPIEKELSQKFISILLPCESFRVIGFDKSLLGVCVSAKIESPYLCFKMFFFALFFIRKDFGGVSGFHFPPPFLFN